MFIDKVQVSVQAGNGGNGFVSFRHEIYVDRGGPDGGDGGNGGNIIMVASWNQNTLANFRFQKAIKADDGIRGDKQRKHGRSGKNLEVPVPVGTIVTDEEGGILADLHEDGQRAVIAYGGKGGFGNAHFVSSTRQAPRVAERGELGDSFKATLELKMIADVGLVGLPNAGKSTLLSVVSNARPEIADYPFTTLTPNLGVVDVDKDTSLLFADIPGLIEGASAGKGLGDEFLRHIERTKILVHLVSVYNESVADTYKTIKNELKKYKTDLSTRPEIVVLSQIDGVDTETLDVKMKELKKVVPKSTPLFAISAKSKLGLKEFLYSVKNEVTAERARIAAEQPADSGITVYKIDPNQRPWKIIKRKDGYLVRGHKIEKFASRTDYQNEEGVRRLRDIMKKMGIMRELERHGIEKDQKIEIGQHGSITY
jgi:GTP-binding protein